MIDQIKISVRCRIFIFLVLAIFTGKPAWSASEQDYLEDAQKYFSQGEYKSTVIQLKNVLQTNKENLDARFLLMKTYLKVGMGSAAEKEIVFMQNAGYQNDLVPGLLESWLLQRHYNKVIKKTDQLLSEGKELSSNILISRAKALILEGQYGKAEKIINSILAKNKNDVKANILMGQFLASNKNREQAEKYIDNALLLAPENMEALLIKASWERDKGNHNKSIEIYKKVIKAEPENIQVLLGLSSSYISLKQFDEALKHIEPVRKQYPNYPFANYLRAVIHVSKNEFKSGKDVLYLVQKMAPEFPSSYFLLGMVHYSLQEFVQAEDQFVRYLKINENDLQVHKMLISTHLKLKQARFAIEILKPLLEKYPEDIQLISLAGTAYMQQGDFNKGTDYLQKASELAPDQAEIHTQLALGKLAKGDTKQAISSLQTAADTSKDLYQADVLLVMINLRNKWFDKAIDAANNLKKKMPDNPLPYNLLGSAYAGKNEITKARQYYNDAIKIKPDYIAARINLAKLSLMEKDVESAKKYFNEILEYNKNHLQALLGLAQLAAQNSEREKFVSLLERAGNANLDAIEPRVLLARHYLSQGKQLKALNIVNELLSKHPKNPIVLTLAGAVQEKAGKDSSAVTSFRRLIELQPEFHEGYFLLAMVQNKIGSTSDAIINLKKTLELKSDYMPALAALAEIEASKGSLETALVYVEKIKKLQPGSHSGLQLEGDIFYGKRKYKKAEKAYAGAFDNKMTSRLAIRLFQTRDKLGSEDKNESIITWLAKNPDDYSIRTILASSLDKAGKSDQAVTHYLKILEGQPDNVVVLNNIAWAYHNLGDKKSLLYAERAYKKGNNKPEIIDTYGWILVQQGQINKGLVYLQEAVSKAPHLPEIRYHLAAALEKASRKNEAVQELKYLVREHRKFSYIKQAQELLKKLESR